jgi:hypothetical protein
LEWEASAQIFSSLEDVEDAEGGFLGEKYYELDAVPVEVGGGEGWVYGLLWKGLLVGSVLLQLRRYSQQ